MGERKEKEAEKMEKLHQQMIEEGTVEQGTVEEDLTATPFYSGQENLQQRMSLSTTNLIKNKIEARKMSMVLSTGVVGAKRIAGAVDRSSSITSITSTAMK